MPQSKMTKPYIKQHSFSVGNLTVSKSHGAVLFLNLKTLKCPYLYASANWRKQQFD